LIDPGLTPKLKVSIPQFWQYETLGWWEAIATQAVESQIKLLLTNFWGSRFGNLATGIGEWEF